MLLRHTPDTIIERQALTVQPAKTCQPVGAMYAALGIHRCLPHSHGSQGCCAYHRSSLTRHYKEPVMAATSSFTEGSSVFGGQANLIEAISNIFNLYNPDVLAIHTTCLSETIGDDVLQIVAKARDEGKVPKDKYIIKASTPSYTGSHVIGFANMVKGIIDGFSVSGKKMNHINIIPGFVEPSDMSEIKRIVKQMGIDSILFPDTSGVLNTPQTGHYEMYPKGGTTIDDLKRTGLAQMTLGLGHVASGPGAKFLDSKCGVPCNVIKLPIGIRATDEFIETLRQLGGTVSDKLEYDRGQVMDTITDMAQYFYQKKVALIGDPDQLVSLTEFLTDLGFSVRHVITGTPGKKFVKRIQEAAGTDNVNVRESSDYFYLHQLIKNEKVDLIMGNSYAKYISRDEDIPLVRIGFPIYDRIGHQYYPVVGYRGALRLIERMLNALLDYQDKHAPEEQFELVM